VVAGLKLYSNPIPLIAVSEADFAKLQTGDHINIDNSGIITIST